MTETKKAKLAADTLQAVGEPSRIAVVKALIGGKKNVTEIAKLLGTEIVNASHHLKVLRNAGLVDDEKEGRFVNYTLSARWKKASSAAAIEAGDLRLVVNA